MSTVYIKDILPNPLYLEHLGKLIEASKSTKACALLYEITMKMLQNPTDKKYILEFTDICCSSFLYLEKYICDSSEWVMQVSEMKNDGCYISGVLEIVRARDKHLDEIKNQISNKILESIEDLPMKYEEFREFFDSINQQVYSEKFFKGKK